MLPIILTTDKEIYVFKKKTESNSFYGCVFEEYESTLSKKKQKDL